MLYGLEYDYLTQPIVLPSGALYQPDFWLPSLEITCKVGESESKFSVNELSKTIEFSYKERVLLMLGYPGYESLYLLSERRNIKDQDIDSSTSDDQVEEYFEYLREWGHWVQFSFDVHTRDPILAFRALIPNDDGQLSLAYEAAAKVMFSVELGNRPVDDKYFFDHIHERHR